MFRWVHISDLHFYNSKRDDIREMKASLPKEFSKLNDIDALFITGDLRFAKEYKDTDDDKIVKYIQELADALKISLENVFLVPGNHDLDRGNVREAVIQSLRNNNQYDPQKGYFEEDVLDSLKKGFKFFIKIDEQIHNESLLFKDENVHSIVNLEKCNIILLNTAITAGNDDDRGYLFLGSKYLQGVLNKIDPAKPTIMIGHHGNSFINREENKYIQNKLKNANVHVYLCGHEHSITDETVWDNIIQYTAGCIWNSEKSENTTAGYYVGEIDENNVLHVNAYRWFAERIKWQEYSTNINEPPLQLLPNKQKKKPKKKETDNNIDNQLMEIKAEYRDVPAKKINLMLNGHTLLGGLGKDGIKYYWIKNGNRVESLAFNTRTCYPHHDRKIAEEDAEISSYTISTSFGCVLSANNQQCRFCETGSREFKGNLTSDEIALQCIFMALYDADCPSFPEVKNHKREFAFMGQGEPGYNYAAIRRAIQLTDIAMEAIGQDIHRYIISSCGISDFMPQLINDVKSGIYKNKVDLHFSLHSIGDTRKVIMPIENTFSYKEFLQLCHDYYEISKEKIGIGILMFKNFSPILSDNDSSIQPITLDEKTLIEILSELDNQVFRIDLCDFNPAPSVTKKRGEVKNSEAIKLLKIALDYGFEAKTFSSFGSDKNAGCGMLKSVYNDATEDGENTLEQLRKALSLLHYATQRLKDKNRE